MARRLSAVVLASGDGSRMQSTRPKPLHVLCGRAMVLYILDALLESGVDRVIMVVGAGAERVAKKLNEDGPELPLDFVEQRIARGSGDAAAVGLTAFGDDDPEDSDVLVLPGDTPLLRAETLRALVQTHLTSGAAATVLTARAADPGAQARVVRGREERVVRVVEHEDAEPDERVITEAATGVYCFRRSLLSPALRRLDPRNTRGELTLSDVVRVLAGTGHEVATHEVGDPTEVVGVDDRRQLAVVEAELRRRTNLGWLDRGVTFVDPEQTYLDTTVSLGADVTLFPGVILQGRTVVGEGAEIGPNTRLVDCAVEERARVEQTVARDAEIGADAVVGPFAVLSPGASVAAGAATGPFYTSATDD